MDLFIIVYQRIERIASLADEVDNSRFTDACS